VKKNLRGLRLTLENKQSKQKADSGGAAMKKVLKVVWAVLLVLALVATSFGCAQKEEKETKKKEEKKPTESAPKPKTKTETEPKTTEFTVTSPGFEDGANIPIKYAHTDVSGGENTSIPLAWDNLPDGTKSVAVAMIDKSANNFQHWLVLNIPPETTTISEGASGKSMPTDATEFNNTFGQAGYGGPAPPPGEAHDYEITIYALSIPSMSMTENAGLNEFLSFVEGKILGKAVIVGRFTQ